MLPATSVYVDQDNVPLRPDQRILINCIGDIAPAKSQAYQAQEQAQEQANRQGHRISEWEITTQGIYVGMCDMCSLVAFAVPRGAIFGTALTFYCDVQAYINAQESTGHHKQASFNPTPRPYCEACGNGTTLVGRECKKCTNIVPRAYNIIPSNAPAYSLSLESKEERTIMQVHYKAHKCKVYQDSHRTSRYELYITYQYTTGHQLYKYTHTILQPTLCHNGHKATATHHYIIKGYKPRIHGYNPPLAIAYNCSEHCKREHTIERD